MIFFVFFCTKDEMVQQGGDIDGGPVILRTGGHKELTGDVTVQGVFI